MNKEHLSRMKHDLSSAALVGLCLYFIAIISSIILVGIEPVIAIKRPWVLLCVSLAGFIPVKVKNFSIVQKLLVVYFLCMLLSQLTLEKTVLGGQSFRMILPKSLIPLLLYGIAFLLLISNENIQKFLSKNQSWYWIWITAFMIVIVHMVCLWIPLKSMYGYGYTHNLGVLGNLVLYMMCFVFTWNILDRLWINHISLVCMVLYLLVLIVF